MTRGARRAWLKVEEHRILERKKSPLRGASQYRLANQLADDRGRRCVFATSMTENQCELIIDAMHWLAKVIESKGRFS